MGNRNQTEYYPEVAVAPGETIRENMEYLGIDQDELAIRLEISPKHLSQILNGCSPITYETALKLESVIGPDADFWMNLETNFQLDKIRLKRKTELSADLVVLDKIPYMQMSKLNWVPRANSNEDRVNFSREFFGVASLAAITPSYAVTYRKHRISDQITDFASIAWLRQAERESLKISVDEFSKRKLKAQIPFFRTLTLQEPTDFIPKLQAVCASCGIALVIIPYLPRTRIVGAFIWIKDKAILALSNRGKKVDIFWFAFFHEIAHLLEHSERLSHIRFETELKEEEADGLAGKFLIPEREFKSYISSAGNFSHENIVSFARALGIAPYIVVGRLQHEGLIRPDQFNELRCQKPSSSFRSI